MDWNYKTNGRYFFNYTDLGDRTDDIEFKKGKFEGRYHNEDSKYLWISHFACLGLFRPFADVFPDFDEFSDVEIGMKQWEGIVKASQDYSDIIQEMISEINEWMVQTISEHGCVTVLGV